MGGSAASGCRGGCRTASDRSSDTCCEHMLIAGQVGGHRTSQTMRPRVGERARPPTHLSRRGSVNTDLFDWWELDAPHDSIQIHSSCLASDRFPTGTDNRKPAGSRMPDPMQDPRERTGVALGGISEGGVLLDSSREAAPGSGSRNHRRLGSTLCWPVGSPRLGRWLLDPRCEVRAASPGDDGTPRSGG